MQDILVLIRIARDEMVDVEKRVSVRVVMIIRHVLQWVNPKWKMPGNASNALKKLVWSKELTKYVFCHVSPDDREKAALNFLRELWKEVETEEMWQKKDVKEQVTCNI